MQSVVWSGNSDCSQLLFIGHPSRFSKRCRAIMAGCSSRYVFRCSCVVAAGRCKRTRSRVAKATEAGSHADPVRRLTFGVVSNFMLCES
eukprot:4012139-Heterocapsa_arctica.AAC.1